MKIFFTASLSGKDKYITNYEKIVTILKKNGYDLVSNHVLESEKELVSKESLEERQKYQKKFHQWINKADIVVAEISYPSTGVGYQLTHSLEKGKPVLALYTEDKVPVALLGEPSDKLIMAPYSIDKLESVLIDLLNDAQKQMDVRFNFFISPKIGAYLDWISKYKKFPRAVFLRRLIEEHMKRNKEYKGE